MNNPFVDFAKRYDDYIDETPDYMREIAEKFYYLGIRDAKERSQIIYVPIPIKVKGKKNK